MRRHLRPVTHQPAHWETVQWACFFVPLLCAVCVQQVWFMVSLPCNSSHLSCICPVYMSRAVHRHQCDCQKPLFTKYFTMYSRATDKDLCSFEFPSH